MNSPPVCHTPRFGTPTRLAALCLLLWIQLLASSASISGEGEHPVPDLRLVDHHGQGQQLRSKVVADRVVVMNFIYTDCSAACPVSTAIMKSVHGKLATAGLLGDRVVLVSVSVNPVVDTPRRLERFAREHGALGTGWYWLTGSQRNVDRLLLALHAYTAQAREHPSVILVGRGAVEHWTPLYGFPGSTQVLEQVYRHLGEPWSGG